MSDSKAQQRPPSRAQQLWERGNSGVRSRAIPAGAAPEELIGERYRIMAPLGMGALGRVYRARQVQQGRDVALKILNAELVSDPAVRARFQLEVATCAQLSHPNIANVLDYGVTDGQPGLHYIVSELATGETLDEFLNRRGPLPPMRALRIARQVGRALREAHKEGVVHRDLKPSNIMIQTLPDGETVKVLDFGLALVRRDDGAEASSLVRCYGAPGYMAPEQVTGDEVDGRADIYALGVLMFQMLTGARPYRGQRVSDILERQLLKPLPRMSDRAPVHVPRDVEELVRRCIHPDKSQRWPDVVSLMGTMRALLAADQQFLSMEPPETGPGSWGVLSVLPSVPPAREPEDITGADGRVADLWAVLLAIVVLGIAAMGTWQLAAEPNSAPIPKADVAGP